VALRRCESLSDCAVRDPDGAIGENVRMRDRFAAGAGLAIWMLGAAGVAGEEKGGPWSGTAELSYVATSGNTDTETAGGAVSTTYDPGIWSLKGALSYVRSRNEGELDAEKLVGELKLRRDLRPGLDGFVRGRYLENRFAGIRSSVALDAGVVWKVLEGERHTLGLSAGAGYLTESRVADRDREFASLTVGGDYAWKISETTELTEALSWTGHLDDRGDDWRLSYAAALVTSINSVFSIKLSHTLDHRNQPPTGFGKRDSVSSVALVAKF